MRFRFLMTLLVLALLGAAPVGSAVAAGPVPAAPAASPSTAPAGLGIKLLDIPASLQNDPRARTYVIDRLAPGSEIQRRIQVENNTGAAQTVRLYSGAAHIDNGVFVGDEAGSHNDLSTWTTLATPEVQIPAGGKEQVLVTISVPADASEGEQYAAVWAEMRSPADKGGVVQANRVGIRLYLSVGPGNGKPADFVVTSLAPSRDAEGRPQLSGLVTNTGGRALDVTGELKLTGGPGGISAGPFSVQAAVTIAPGSDQNVTFTLPRELPNGPWTAEISLKSGLLERKATADVTFPEAGPGAPLATTGQPDNQWLPVAALTAAVIIAIIIAFVLRRKRLHRHANTDA